MERKGGWFGKVLMYSILQIGAMLGVPMRPEDIERMTRLWNDSVVSEAEEKEEDDSGDPPSGPGRK